MASMLRTVVLVLVPACLVHSVLTLGNNLIAFLKGGFAVIAGLSHHLTVEAHLAPQESGDIFAFEQLVQNIGHKQLHDEVDEQ